MSDRTRTATLSSLIAAASFLFFASAAGAQDQKDVPAKPVRHVDVEAGAGVHFGTAKSTPIEDDFYANIGVAGPFTERFDGELQLGYWTSGNTGKRRADGTPKHDARTGWYLHAGVRFYLVGAPDAVTRFYFAAGPSMITDYREDDDVTPAFTLGPGFRFLVGKRTGLVLRVPIALMLEGDPEPLMLPTLNFLYQF